MSDLRLAAIDGELTIGVGPVVGIADCARAFADAVESGKIKAERVIAAAVVDGMVEFTCFGPSPSIIEGVGPLEMAKDRVLRGAYE